MHASCIQCIGVLGEAWDGALSDVRCPVVMRKSAREIITMLW